MLWRYAVLFVGGVLLKPRLCLCFFLTLALAGCAFDVVHVTQIPAQLEPARGPANAFLLENDVQVDLGTGFSRQLRTGTRWESIGRIDKGDVYRTRDQVLTVEASHVHEAYIVVRSDKLVGFYLPVEKTFSPLPQPATLAMKAVP